MDSSATNLASPPTNATIDSIEKANDQSKLSPHPSCSPNHSSWAVLIKTRAPGPDNPPARRDNHDTQPATEPTPEEKQLILEVKWVDADETAYTAEFGEYCIVAAICCTGVVCLSGAAILLAGFVFRAKTRA
jgi:hypothetical protein